MENVEKLEWLVEVMEDLVFSHVFSRSPKGIGSCNEFISRCIIDAC